MTAPLYVGSLDTVAEALRHAAAALSSRGYLVVAAKIEADALEVDALHAAEVAAAAELHHFREDEPTREVVPVLPSKKEKTEP